MGIQDDGRVTMTVKELDKHLRVRADSAMDVATAGTALIVIVANALGFRWAAHSLLALALVRIGVRWMRDKPSP